MVLRNSFAVGTKLARTKKNVHGKWYIWLCHILMTYVEFPISKPPKSGRGKNQNTES